MRIIFNASSTASPDSLCGRVDDPTDAWFWRFGDVLTSAINKPLSAGARSIAPLLWAAISFGKGDWHRARDMFERSNSRVAREIDALCKNLSAIWSRYDKDLLDS